MTSPHRWAAHAAGLLYLATTASALTLSSFQLITSSGTPIACLIVYSSTLAGCSTRDFTSGNACSPACVAGIADVQARVVDVCDGVDASAASVLGQALRGNLVPLLCPSRSGAEPSTRLPPVVATTVTLSTASPPRSSSFGISSLTTALETARSRPPPPPPPAAGTPLASDLPPPPVQPTPTFVQSERPAQRPTETSTGGGRGQPTRDSDSSGGGSPFDAVSRGGAGRGVEVGGWGLFVAAAAVGLLVVR
ncbi:hypothetical protein QBC39DRAFT_376401 [Podospora conica]|nr:hypothetical protein QBC39DRAFT_376401 [Schizothecium conicum]